MCVIPVPPRRAAAATVVVVVVVVVAAIIGPPRPEFDVTVPMLRSRAASHPASRSGGRIIQGLLRELIDLTAPALAAARRFLIASISFIHHWRGTGLAPPCVRCGQPAGPTHSPHPPPHLRSHASSATLQIWLMIKKIVQKVLNELDYFPPLPFNTSAWRRTAGSERRLPPPQAQYRDPPG